MNRADDEPVRLYLDRCMTSWIMNKEFPDASKRLAACISKSREPARGDVNRMVSEEIEYMEISKSYEETI